MESDPVSYPGCLAILDNIKEWWLGAKTACRAHEATLARKERYHHWNNWATLVLSVLTALAAMLVPIFGEQHPVIFGITIAMAILTSLSKGVEQTFARPEDTPAHHTALASLRGTLAELNVVAGQIYSHVLKERDLSLEKTHANVQALGVAIEETRRIQTATERDDHRRCAALDFDETQIRQALDYTMRMLQKQTKVSYTFLEVDAVIDKRVKAFR